MATLKRTPATQWPAEIRLTPAKRFAVCREQAALNCQNYSGGIATWDCQWRGVCAACLDAAGYRPVCERPAADENAPGYTDAVCANCGQADCRPTKLVR